MIRINLYISSVTILNCIAIPNIRAVYFIDHMIDWFILKMSDSPSRSLFLWYKIENDNEVSTDNIDIATRKNWILAIISVHMVKTVQQLILMTNGILQTNCW